MSAIRGIIRAVYFSHDLGSVAAAKLVALEDGADA